MTYMNDTANIKQFRLIKFINENCDDDHLMAKISIVLRRDKIARNEHFKPQQDV